MNKKVKNRIKNGFLKGTVTSAFLILLIGMASVDYTPMNVVIPAIIIPMMWIGIFGYAQVRR